MKKIFLVIFILQNTLSYSQTIMGAKDAFFYGLRENNLKAGDKLSYAPGIGNAPTDYQLGDLYASYFDKVNYINSVNDEFKRVPYLTRYFNELNDGIKNVDFKKTFYFLVNAPFGTYNTACGCFPLNRTDLANYTRILLSVKEIGNAKLWYDNSFIDVNIRRYFNLNDFDFALKMKSMDAEKFIDSRKDNYGNINRNVTIKVIYNVVDRKFEADGHKYYIGVYVQKLEYYNGQILLGSELPKYDYYDKVNLVKMKDGTDKVFYDNNGNVVNKKDSMNASFYRVTNYKDGKMQELVTDYFMNGTKQMEGEFADNGNKDGKFRWYDENGKIIRKANYARDLQEGAEIEYYPNGNKRSQALYSQGKKYGCEYKWDEKGQLVSDNYYIADNGSTDYSKECIVKRTLLTPNIDIQGQWTGIIKRSGEDFKINADKSCEYHAAGKVYNGKAELKPTNELDDMSPYDLDQMCLKIEKNLGKKVGICKYVLSLSIIDGAGNKETPLLTFTDGTTIYAWAGDGSYYAGDKIPHDQIAQLNGNNQIGATTVHSDFNDDYNKELPDGDYSMFKNILYYKSNGLRIEDASISDDQNKNILISEVRAGQQFHLFISVAGFVKQNGKVRYILAESQKDAKGNSYGSSGDGYDETTDDFIGLRLGAGIRALANGVNSKDFYFSFKIKDRNSNAVIHGYFKFTVVR